LLGSHEPAGAFATCAHGPARLKLNVLMDEWQYLHKFRRMSRRRGASPTCLPRLEGGERIARFLSDCTAGIGYRLPAVQAGSVGICSFPLPPLAPFTGR